MGEGFLEEVSFVLCLEGWAESSSVEKVELVGEGILGRRSGTDEGVEECKYSRELQAGLGGWNMG